MKLLLAWLLLPLCVVGQEIGSVGALSEKPWENPVLHLNNLSDTVAGLQTPSNDSLAGKDTTDFMISCGCGGKRVGPRVFVNGYETLPMVLAGLSAESISSFSIEREGIYAEGGAVFVETKQGFKSKDSYSLASFLKKKFRAYDKRDVAKYIINGAEYPDPDIRLPKHGEVSFVSVSYADEVAVENPVATYTLTFQIPN